MGKKGKKPSPLGKGGIHQKVWDYMRPDTRALYNQVYPDSLYGRTPTRMVLTPIGAQPLVSDADILMTYRPQNPHLIAYRVIALDGPHPNHAGLSARSTDTRATIVNAKMHLRLVHFDSPWISLTTSLASALRRAAAFRAAGATQVFVMVIHTELIQSRCIDAHRFAKDYKLPNPSMKQGEVLCFKNISESSVLFSMPVTYAVQGPSPGPRLTLPRLLLDEAVATYSLRLTRHTGSPVNKLIRMREAVSCWIFDAFWANGTLTPQANMEHIMQFFEPH